MPLLLHQLLPSISTTKMKVTSILINLRTTTPRTITINNLNQLLPLPLPLPQLNLNLKISNNNNNNNNKILSKQKSQRLNNGKPKSSTMKESARKNASSVSVVFLALKLQQSPILTDPMSCTIASAGTTA